jgi:TolB protein
MRFLFFIIMLHLSCAGPAYAGLRVDINKGVESAILIAVPYAVPRAPISGTSPALGSEIADVIANDLASTSFFKPIDRDLYAMAMPVADAETPRFSHWRSTRGQALVTGAIAEVDGDVFRLECRLFDIFSGEPVAARNFVGRKDQWRQVSHVCANFVYEALVGEPGHFDSRILYVSESGSGEQRIKRLAEMDYDGAGHSYLSKGVNMVATPVYAPGGGTVVHLAFAGSTARIYLVNLATRATTEIGPFDGVAFGPRFSPDGASILLSIGKNGNTDIYRIDLDTSKIVKLTEAPGTDTGASYSPDGRKILFESNRSGSQQLYMMNADGSEQSRITFGKARYGAASWSPKGDLLAFTRIAADVASIGVMRSDGQGERMLTRSMRDESPAWAPSGRAIVFMRTGSGSRASELWTIDLTGTVERRLPLPEGGSDPAWSPSRGALPVTAKR